MAEHAEHAYIRLCVMCRLALVNSVCMFSTFPAAAAAADDDDGVTVMGPSEASASIAARVYYTLAMLHYLLHNHHEA